jgi:hypothetical protein
LGDENFPVVQRPGPYANEDFTRLRLRLRDVLDAQVLRAADLM